MNETFETERLRAERIGRHHGPEFHRLHRDPDVARTIGGVLSDEALAEAFEKSLEHWDEHGFGPWMFYALEDGRFIGRGFVRWAEIDGARVCELGYAFLPAEWGRGFATETARAMVRIAFGDVGVDEVVAVAVETNDPSMNVMRKIGMTYSHDCVYKTLPVRYFRIERSSARPESS